MGAWSSLSPLLPVPLPLLPLASAQLQLRPMRLPLAVPCEALLHKPGCLWSLRLLQRALAVALQAWQAYCAAPTEHVPGVKRAGQRPLPPLTLMLL